MRERPEGKGIEALNLSSAAKRGSVGETCNFGGQQRMAGWIDKVGAIFAAIFASIC